MPSCALYAPTPGHRFGADMTYLGEVPDARTDRIDLPPDYGAGRYWLSDGLTWAQEVVLDADGAVTQRLACGPLPS